MHREVIDTWSKAGFKSGALPQFPHPLMTNKLGSLASMSPAGHSVYDVITVQMQSGIHILVSHVHFP